jgi:hypothetical protein
MLTALSENQDERKAFPDPVHAAARPARPIGKRPRVFPRAFSPPAAYSERIMLVSMPSRSACSCRRCSPAS